MFSTVKKENTTQKILGRNQVDASSKKRLQAQWHKIDGKLVCRWIKV